MPKISYEIRRAPGSLSKKALLAIAALIVAGALLQGWEGFAPTREKLQKTSITYGESDLTKLHSLLLEENAMEVANSGPLKSSAVGRPWASDGLATISVVSNEEGLYAESTGIIPNAMEKGRRWERDAQISYFDQGQLRYETPAGLRVHGGMSRKGSIKSFSILFRRTYAGRPRSKENVFFHGTGQAAQRIVLSNAALPHRFLNPLALEIAESLGCITSRTQPVRFVLNGQPADYGYFLIEHQSREFLKHRYGHDDFDWYRLKSESRTAWSLEELRSWIGNRKALVNQQTAKEWYDLDDLQSWILAISFCDTHDEDQGAYFRDQKKPGDAWHSLTWDMDISFHRGEPVEKQAVNFDRIRGIRGRLFRRLCESDPAFRQSYRMFAERMLTTSLAEPRLRALVEKYRAIAKTEPFQGNREDLLNALNGTETFILERRKIYLRELDAYFSGIKSEK